MRVKNFWIAHLNDKNRPNLVRECNEPLYYSITINDVTKLDSQSFRQHFNNLNR